MKRILLVAILVLLGISMPAEAKPAKWTPDRLPTVDEVAEAIRHVVRTYDAGACGGKTYRTKHPRSCVREGGRWHAANPGVTYWHNPETREQYYDIEVLRGYAKREYEVARELGACPADGSFSRKCFDLLVTVNEEFLRQTKFRPEAHSRYNRANDEMCQDAKFRTKWKAQCKKTSRGRWVTTGVKFQFVDPWCKRQEKRHGHLTDAFRRSCKPSRIQRADLGMGQQHMSTLNHLGREYCTRHPDQCGEGGWHYTMVRDPDVSIWVTTFWIVQQSEFNRCGRWLTGRLTRGKIRGLGRRSITYSCLATKRAGGWPMKVGNPENAVRMLHLMRASFQAVMTKSEEPPEDEPTPVSTDGDLR